MERESGVVKNFLADRGFGFVTSKKGDIFFHIKNGKNVEAGENCPVFSRIRLAREPEKGDCLTFEVVKGEKGYCADLWYFTEEWEQAAQKKSVSRMAVPSVVEIIGDDTHAGKNIGRVKPKQKYSHSDDHKKTRSRPNEEKRARKISARDYQ